MSEEKYRICRSVFKEYDDDGAATYEFTFNKSLEHTGRFNDIENGLNSPNSNKAKEEAIELLSDLSVVDKHNALEAVRDSLGRLRSIINNL